MAMVITDDSILCGASEPECPNEAISEGDEAYVIDPNNCTECEGEPDGPKCVPVCPEECIEPLR